MIASLLPLVALASFVYLQFRAIFIDVIARRGTVLLILFATGWLYFNYLGGREGTFSTGGLLFVLFWIAFNGPVARLLDRRTRPIYKPITYRSTAVNLNLIGTQPGTIMEGLGRAPAMIGYIVGNDPQKWRSEVGQFDRIITRDIYQGIDLAYHGDKGSLEYDFIVKPGANPKIIRFAIDGERSLRLSMNGDLIIETDFGELRHRKPYIFQEIDGTRREVEGRFVLDASQLVSFEIEAYDHSVLLVIDL